ncbi:hypothetical protein [uncultured Shewanella sp.]|uniref:hypothetical protein n=1 Tax=uncultured Shewanella sp. TaxID=173975 RepID=UPI00263639CD|nr:hypothetical protein [uncultured Shewanella sp.]
MDRPDTTQEDATRIKNLYSDMDNISAKLHFKIDANSESKREFIINKYPIIFAYTKQKPLLHVTIINDVLENLFLAILNIIHHLK